LWFKFIDDEMPLGADRGKCYGFEAGLKDEAEVTALIPDSKNDAQQWSMAAAFIRRAKDITRRALACEDLDAFVWSDGISFVANHVRSDIERFPLKFRGIGTRHRVCRNVDPSTMSLGHPRIAVALELEFAADVFTFEEGTTTEGRIIAPGDIRGGRAKNHPFTSALSMLSCDENLLYDIMPDVPPTLRRSGVGEQQEFNKSGVYAFRFYRDGQWRIVVVDDYLAVDSDSQELVFAKPPHENFELYSVLAEKAFAKLNGSYKLTERGSVAGTLADLAGAVPFHYRIGTTVDGQYGGASGGAGCERLWNDMRALRDEFSLVGCSWTSSGAANTGVQFEGIYADVAYAVVALHDCTLESGETQRLVQIRSPRGHVGAYTGAWRAGGSEWERVAVEEKQRINYRVGMDSTFFMSLNDFFQVWTSLHVGRMLMPTPYRQSMWTQYNIIGEFGVDNLGLGTGTLAQYTQFQLKLTEDCEVVVSVDISDSRVLQHVAAQNGELATTYEGATNPGIALPILNHVRDENPVGQIYEGMLVQSGPIFMSQERWHSVQYSLRAGDGAFNIVPTTHRKYAGPYFLRVFTSKPSTLKPLR
jgi:hypothetical protein